MLAAIGVAVPSAGLAQPNPSFAYRKPDDVVEAKVSEWTARAEVGFVLTTGNSENVTATAGGTLARRADKNKLELTASATYARASSRAAIDRNGNGTIGPGEIVSDGRTTAETIEAKLRYDRYLSDMNSLYVAALARRDRPAGKELVGGGQVGYSRVLKKTDQAEAVVEVGYDLTFEDLVARGDTIVIHSARAFVGYKGTVSADNAFEASVELLANVNSLDTPTGEIGAFGDDRVTGHAAWTSKIGADLSLAFSFDVKFDSAPAPLGIAGATFDPGYVPESSKIDSLFKGSIIYSFF
jgi:hypothetical protein